MKRFFAIIVAVILCISVLGACGEDKKLPAGDSSLNDGVVGTINGVEISQADFNLIYKMLYENMSQYQQYYGDDWIVQPYDGVRTLGQFLEDSSKSQLEQLIVAEAIAEEKYGIKADEKITKAAEKQRDEYITSLGGNEAYEQFLKDMRTTNEAVLRSFEMIEIYNRFEKKITAKGEEAYIDDKDALEDFKSEKMRVQHILISTQEQNDPETGEVKPARSEEEALKLVDEVLAKLEKGEDFDSLIEKYDEDPGMEPGKFYVFGTGEMVPEFENASMELKEGEYTKEAVKTDYGYHIIKKYDINADISEFKDYKTQLMQEKMMGVVDSKLADCKVEWKDEELNKYVFEWVNAIRKEQGLEPLTEEAMNISFPTEEDLNTENAQQSDAENDSEEEKTSEK